MFKIRMVGGVGIHDTGELDSLGNAIILSPGSQYETEKPLHQLFPDKFVLVEEVDSPETSAAPLTSAPSAPAKKAAAKAKPKPAPAGEENVTAKFPSAEANGLTVLLISGLYSIRRGEEVLSADLQSETLVVTEIDEILQETK